MFISKNQKNIVKLISNKQIQIKEEKRQFDLRAERERRLLAGESIDSPKSNSERKTKVRRKKKTARN